MDSEKKVFVQMTLSELEVLLNYYCLQIYQLTDQIEIEPTDGKAMRDMAKRFVEVYDELDRARGQL